MSKGNIMRVVREDYCCPTQRPNSCDQRGDDQWEDESLQHPEEDLPDVGDVHHLPLVPALLALAEDQAEHDPADDAAHGGDSEEVHPQTSHGSLCSAHPKQESQSVTTDYTVSVTAQGQGPSILGNTFVRFN